MIRSPRALRRAAVLLAVGALTFTAPAAARPVPASPPAVAARHPPSLSGAPFAGARRLAPRRKGRHRGRSVLLRSIAIANAAARDGPSAGAYVNSALIYNYEPGRLYTIRTSPRFLTTITLQPGEKLIAKAAGDTVRWVLGETAQGTGPQARVVVLVKPVQADLRTNIVLTTDQRTYLIDATSSDGAAYTPLIAWNYPQDEARELAAQLARTAVQATSSVETGLSVERLNFRYRIEVPHGPAPKWRPLRVFDDGAKTYIEFPADLGAAEAPPLFLIGPAGQAELVNYRVKGGYYIVDRLLDLAELRLGDKTQVVVRIRRLGRPDVDG
jgi:P-type conjugative transfer protein TrbG